MACSMCSGTDCAAACSQGYCYAEEQERQSMESAAEEGRMQEAWEAEMQERWERDQLPDQRLMCDP